jgi:hypothetical protein
MQEDRMAETASAEAAPAPEPVPEPAAPLILQQDIPLCEGIPPEKNGVLEVYSIEPLESLRARLEGVFSVVLYYSSKQTAYKKQLEDFKKTPYYKGVLHMLRIVHREGGPFRNWGFVLYTDAGTINFLQSVFPFSQFPKLCLILVNWPFYSNSAGFIDTSILRCLRFQVMDLFPNQICLIRDADTLFQRVLSKTVSSDENVTNAIEAWEAHFVQRWRSLGPSPPLIIGTSILYKKEWHVNTPLALAFPLDVGSKFIPYGTFLKQEDVMYGAEYGSKLFGVLAGFVNVAADKSTLQGIWPRCVEYLQTRFFMARFPYKYKYKRYISNSFSYKYYGAQVGKDEKCILFVMCRYYLPSIYFYDIHYSAETGLGRTMEYFTYLVEGTRNSKSSWNTKRRGYSNDNTVTRELELETVPLIEITPSPKVESHLLNPASIDMVFDRAMATPYTHDFMGGIPLLKTEPVYPLHMFYHQKMAEAMAAYEQWLVTTDHRAIYETLKQQLKQFATSPDAQGVAKDINTTTDDLFLQSAGIYSVSEETFFSEKYKANKVIKNEETARKASAELAAQLAAAPGGVPEAEVAPKGGYHRKTRKCRRFIRKRNAATRRRS